MHMITYDATTRRVSAWQETRGTEVPEGFEARVQVAKNNLNLRVRKVNSQVIASLFNDLSNKRYRYRNGIVFADQKTQEEYDEDDALDERGLIATRQAREQAIIDGQEK